MHTLEEDDDNEIREDEVNALVDDEIPNPDPNILRVKSSTSPFFYAFYKHHIVKILIDSGATSSLISSSFAHKVGLNIKPTQHGAKQLDKSPLKVSGEVKFNLSFGETTLQVDGLVNGSLECDILAGVPFCETNNIDIFLSRQLISIGDQKFPYGTKPESIQHTIYRTKSVILRNDESRTLYPGDYVEINSSDLSEFENSDISIEPRIDSPQQGKWPPPTMSRVIQGTIRIPNDSEEPVKINKCQHFAQIRFATTSDIITTMTLPQPSAPPIAAKRQNTSLPYSSSISTDPDQILSADMRQKFYDAQKRWDNVFNPRFGRYNGASGPFMGSIKFGSVEPPPTKPKIPFYNQSNLQLLQEEADKLEEHGVLVRPEDAGIDVKFASPSFLRRKPSGGHRFVTSFTELGQYIRTLPTTTISSDKIIRQLAKWRYVVKTDLTQSFFQIPISRDSMPYLATTTPFKGLRVYTTPVMGMPGSSEILQELLSHIFGNELTEGWILIIADDMYICANSDIDLLSHWEIVLEKMNRNGLSLSATKTFVCPKSFDVLGWRWTSGTLSVTPHKVTPLISASPPKTCSNMRSFIGAFKAMSRCIPRYSSLMSPLEESIKGLEGPQHIKWTDDLLQSFNQCKEALKSPTVLTIPTPEDKLILTTDASPVNSGIGATLYVCRDNKRLIAECFSLKLKTHHLNWEPCELEALAIASAIQHFSPYVRESHHPLEVLTDNRPCTQAFVKLRKGSFSASARVSTFLSTLSQYNVIMGHLKGTNNLSSDYASRNPMVCTNSCCQICQFVEELSNSVINQVTVEDVLSGTIRMPYMNKKAWQAAQHDSQTLRRVHAHLTQGTLPSKKAKHIRDVKHYLNISSLDSNGLIVVRKPDPFLHVRELIVVPAEILSGLLTALHIQFKHPTKHQLNKLFDRYFYAISSSKQIDDITDHCNQCNSLKKLKKELFEQSSTPSPIKPGEQFASDVIQRHTQCIFATRDIHTSYTTALIVPNQQTDTMRNAILDSTSLMRLPSCTIRIDNAPGLRPLKEDAFLASQGIKLVFGRVKNINKNPVAERNNQELELELNRIDPSGSPITNSTLQQAVKSLNMKIRTRGLSSQEMLFCRDQVTGDQLSLNDHSLSLSQQAIREQNHPHSSKSKASGASKGTFTNLKIGDLVYIKSEGSKNKPRPLYIIMDIVDKMAILQKLLNSKFQTARYEVPLSNIFHAIKPDKHTLTQTTPHHHQSPSSSSDSDTRSVPSPPPTPHSSHSDEDDNPININPPAENDQVPQRSRAGRTLQPPAWLASDEWERFIEICNHSPWKTSH